MPPTTLNSEEPLFWIAYFPIQNAITYPDWCFLSILLAPAATPGTRMGSPAPRDPTSCGACGGFASLGAGRRRVAGVSHL